MANSAVNTALRYGGACFALVIVILSWVLEAELLQGLQGDDGSEDYNKPYFLTWLISSLYSVFLLIWFPMRVFDLVTKEKLALSQALLPAKLFAAEERYVMKAAFAISLPYFICGVFWYISLPLTSVSANTAIYDSSFVFVFILAAIFLAESVSLLKVASVLICLVGVVVVAFSSGGSEETGVTQTGWGYFTLVVSTVLYGAYEVAFKMYGSLPEDRQKKVVEEYKKRKEEERLLPRDSGIQEVEKETPGEEDAEGEEVKLRGMLTSTFFFMGMVGMATFVIYWPGLFILDWLAIEVFQWPDSGEWDLILVNIVFDLLLNIGLVVGITLSTPVFMAVGSLLTMPMSVLTDWLLHDYVLPPAAFLGMAGIVLGFVLLNLAEVLNEKDVVRRLPNADSWPVQLCCGKWQRGEKRAGGGH